MNPGMIVHTELTTDSVPPPLGPTGRNSASYTPLRLIPLTRQIVQILDTPTAANVENRYKTA
jgi:hypothetical protein